MIVLAQLAAKSGKGSSGPLEDIPCWTVSAVGTGEAAGRYTCWASWGSPSSMAAHGEPLPLDFSSSWEWHCGGCKHWRSSKHLFSHSLLSLCGWALTVVPPSFGNVHRACIGNSLPNWNGGTQQDLQHRTIPHGMGGHSFTRIPSFTKVNSWILPNI